MVKVELYRGRIIQSKLFTDMNNKIIEPNPNDELAYDNKKKAEEKLNH